MAKRTVSVLKRQRQQLRRTARNKTAKSKIRTMVKKARAKVLEEDKSSLVPHVRKTLTEIDKAVSKGILHKRTAARKKSRLQRFVNKFSGQSST